MLNKRRKALSVRIFPIYFIALITFILVNTVQAEEQYWKIIKNYITSYDKAKGISENDRIGKEFSEYLNSLTAEQLIQAGRQCSEEFNSEFHRNGFSEGTGFLIAFFIGQYPKTTGLKNLSPIFKDIEDANQTDMWRSALIHAFYDNWSQKLSDNQLRDAANNIDKILEKGNLYYRVTNESLYATRDMLQEIENRNAKNISSANDITEANKGEKEKKTKEITGYYNRFAKRLMSISAEPNLNPELQMVSFALMQDILDKPFDTKAEVESTLSNAVRNYEKYDFKTWRLLSQIGTEKLKLTDSNEITKSMMDKLEERISSEPNNIMKRPLQSELESITRSSRKSVNQ
jgi:hypothetical protein